MVTDSLVLRQFCRLALEKAPDDGALIQPQTLHQLLDRVTELARESGRPKRWVNASMLWMRSREPRMRVASRSRLIGPRDLLDQAGE